MANPRKRQGTKFERECRILLHQAIDAEVRRLAEEGIYDQGDLELQVGPFPVVVEARDREVMQIHRAVYDAKRKARGSISAVIWKRKQKKEGNERRTQVERPIVAMPLDDWLAMMAELNRRSR